MASGLPVLSVRGKRRDVAYSVGCHFQDRIAKYFENYDKLNDDFLPFYETSRGKKICTRFLHTCQDKFHQYVEELEGMAEGSGIDFNKFFLYSLRVEIGALLDDAGSAVTNMGCSTVFVNYKDHVLLGHNEDTHMIVRDTGYVVDATITSDAADTSRADDVEERLVFMCNPGHLYGHAMAVNGHGLVFTINELYLRRVATTGTPCAFLKRHQLTARDVDSLRDIYIDEGTGCASGFSCNVGDVTTCKMYNFEIGPAVEAPDSAGDSKAAAVSQVSVTPVRHCDTPTDRRVGSGYYYHFNMYDHLPTRAEVESAHRVSSSLGRRDRLVELAHLLTDESALLRVLGDSAHRRHPLHAPAHVTDPGATVATGVFNMRERSWKLFTTGKPDTSTPQYTFDINDIMKT